MFKLRKPHSLRDKVVVLTGASSGIGQSLAVAMGQEGAKLVLAARRAEALETTAAEVRAAGGESLVVPTDVAIEADCKALIDAADAEFGAIDILVNNAGITMWARFEEVQDLSIFERIMQVNYMGAVYCTYYALPHLKQRAGQVVAISSLTGLTGVPTRSGYAASKHAMQGFFDSLRIELRRTSVDVTVISPGFVNTEIRANSLSADGSKHAESPRDESGGNMTIDTCVSLILNAIKHRRRDLVMTKLAQVGRWIKLVNPGLVDRIAERKIRER